MRRAIAWLCRSGETRIPGERRRRREMPLAAHARLGPRSVGEIQDLPAGRARITQVRRKKRLREDDEPGGAFPRHADLREVRVQQRLAVFRPQQLHRGRCAARSRQRDRLRTGSAIAGLLQ